jgi:hypothetical protein
MTPTQTARGAVVVMWLVGLAPPAAAQAVDSIYSTHDWAGDCEQIGQPADAAEAAMGANLICPGPDGMQVMLADGDARMSMDYGRQTDFGPWESFRAFNEVHDTVEWRRQRLEDRMVPFATIHRWTVWHGAEERQMLVISTVANGPVQESCMVGYIDAAATPDANQLARSIADRLAPGFVCGNARARGFGYIDLYTPVPHRVAPE